jgi:hypothetical protein
MGLDAQTRERVSYQMRKHISFGIAAVGLALAMTFCAWASVVATSSKSLPRQAGMPYGAAVGSFFPPARVEPTW